MKIADLYIRVSTDEQADKGYSQRNQEEVLRRYCEINSITVRKAILEDHSAKTFNRPAWAGFLRHLYKHKGETDLVFFTKWDRFSRNAADAYQMINTLRKPGIEPQAIEQPLDLTVPENKMMLAFYLAAAEVENDRRALNVLTGMRRAKKEGRWMGYEAQDVLDGKKKKQRIKITVDDHIPLLGFLICPRCGRILTGSGSKGRQLRYYYYHYSSACGIRYRADLANREFIRKIKKYVPHSAALEL